MRSRIGMEEFSWTQDNENNNIIFGRLFFEFNFQGGSGLFLFYQLLKLGERLFFLTTPFREELQLYFKHPEAKLPNYFCQNHRITNTFLFQQQITFLQQIIKTLSISHFILQKKSRKDPFMILLQPLNIFKYSPDNLSYQKIMEQSMEQFFQSRFEGINEEFLWESAKITQKYKNYNQPGLSHAKPIKEYPFMKRYKTLIKVFKYVSAIKPTCLETSHVNSVINEIYEHYMSFCENGGWKSQELNTHIEQFFLLVLTNRYPTLPQTVKKICSQFDRYLLCFCYTLNYRKTSNPLIKTFTCFLNGTYFLGELLIYLCMRNMGKHDNGTEFVSISVVNKILRILEEENYSSNISISESICFTDDSIEDDKKININQIFSEQSAGPLMLGKMRMYKIMKLCKMIKQKQKNVNQIKQKIDWKEFLELYFAKIQENDICFQHILAASVSESLYLLATRIFGEETSERKTNYLEDAYSYIFNILEVIFAENLPEWSVINIHESKTIANISSLRELYTKIKQLHNYNISVTQRFSRMLLKNTYLLQLYKKYQ